MKPYYQHAGITIYNADCREVLPILEPVDLVITDPPYGVGPGKHNGENDKKRGKTKYHITEDWEDTEEYIKNVVVPAFEKSLSISTRAICTPGNRCMFFYPRPNDVGCLFTPASSGWSRWGMTSFSPIYYYGKDPRQGNKGTTSTGMMLTENAPRNGHPCPKPINAWRWLTHKGSLDGETILDPFMGSGTTLRVAKDLGLKAIGIDIEEKSCEIAAVYLQQQVLF